MKAPRAFVETAGALPSSRVHSALGVAVVTATRAVPAPALTAATYSRRPAASIRLKTRTFRSARRTTVEPVESTGWAARSAPSTRSRSETGCPTTSKDEPVPIGALPIRSSLRQWATCVGKRS